MHDQVISYPYFLKRLQCHFGGFLLGGFFIDAFAGFYAVICYYI